MGFLDKTKQAASKAKEVAETVADKAKEQVERKQSELAAQGIVFRGTSHEEGRNSVVTLYSASSRPRPGAFKYTWVVDRSA